MTEKRPIELGRCDLCGRLCRGPVCKQCGTATIEEHDLDSCAREMIPEPSELEARRFAKLNALERFFVGILIKSGDADTLSEALRRVEDAGGRFASSQ
jgi:hypothetical protein